MSAHNIQLFSGSVEIPDDLRVVSLTVEDGVVELGANGAYANVGYVMNNPGGSNAAVYYDKTASQLRVVHTDFGGKEDPNTITISNEDITLNVSGNTYSRFYYGDGGLLSNLVSDLQSVTAVEANSDQMIILSNATALWANVGNVLVEGNVTAGQFHGNGGWLTNVQTTFEETIINGNNTSNIVEFNNAVAFVTTGAAGIQNTAPLGDLSIGANVVFDDDATDILKVQGNINCEVITIGQWVLGGGGSQGLQQITDTGPDTDVTVEFTNTTLAFKTTAKAGIGTSAPSSDAMLHVDGNLRLGGPADTPNNENMYVRAAGALNIIANHSNTDNTTSNLVMKAGEINAASITLAGAVTDDTRQRIVFKTRETEALTIDQFGNANFASNVVVATGAKFIGDGSGLTGLVSDFQSVSEGGDNTDRTIYFTNATEGANITSNLYVGSNLHLDDVTLSAASVNLQGVTTNGASTTDAITITNTTQATTTSTGALKVSGGIAAAMDIRAANVVVNRVGVGLTAGANPDPAHLVEVDGNVKATNVIANNLTLNNVSLQTLYSLDQVVNVNNTTSNIVVISNTTPSTSMSTGCLQLSGGLGVNGNVYAQEFVNTNAGGWRLTHTHATRPTVNGATVGGELTGGNGDVETGFLRLSGGGSTAGTGAPKSYIDICGASASTDFANNITFGIKGSEKVRLTDVGLGVGTVSPGYLLDVHGAANVGTLTTTGRLGLGTATPLTPLHISSTNEITSSPAASAVSQMRYGSTNSTVLFGVSSTAGHISAYDTSNFSTHRDLCLNANGGNVGLGTTSPGVKLHLYDSSSSTSHQMLSIENPHIFGFNAGQDTGSSIVYKSRWQGDGLSSTVDMCTIEGRKEQNANYGDSYISFKTRYETNRNTGGAGTLTEKLRIAGNGNIGVGTTNPNMQLDCYVGTTAYAGIQVRQSSGFARLIANASQGGHNAIVNTGDLGIVFSTDSDHTSDEANKGFYIAPWSSSGASGIRINENGLVGIGTRTPNSSSVFHVFRDASNYGESGDQDTHFQINTAGEIKVQRMSGSTEKAYIKSNMSSNAPAWTYYSQPHGSTWYVGIRAGTGSGSDSPDFKFQYSSTLKAFIDKDDGTVEINFTGQHRTFIKDVPFTRAPDLEGLIVSADQNKYIKMSGGIEAGPNAITTNESLPVVSISTKSKDKKCFGVISTSEDPETRKDAFGSFVTVSQKELGDTRVYINSVGEGAMWVVNTTGPLESGDYITTSNVAGYGMKQDSEFLANYTVAKITMDCDFSPATQPVQIIKKELGNVNCWVETTYSNVALEEYSNLAEENRRTVTDSETVTYQKIDRVESTDEQEGYTLEVREELVNVLDEHGQLQWEDHPTETEKAYKIRYLTADGTQTDEANAVHIAAFVGCTYHCG